MSRRLVRGRIVRIVSPSTVVINLGSENDIGPQTEFRILGQAEEITDPQTGATLGRITVVKGRVRAAQVYDKFTVATSKWTSTSIGPSLDWLGGLARSLYQEEKTAHGEDLTVDPKTLQPWKAASETPVSVGDAVDAFVEVPATPDTPAGPSAKQPSR